MTIKSIISVCLGLLMLPTAKAVEPVKKAKTSAKVERVITAMEQNVSELMADRIGFKKDIGIQKLEEATFQKEVEREDLEFPADDIYGSNWNTDWVDPFAGDKASRNIPDTCAINCSSFYYPLDSIMHITSKYGPRRRRMHRGIDLKVYKGDTIRAAFDGKVRIRSFERRGYGYYIVIRHPNGLETVYGHLSKQLVSVNDIVHAGDPIGLGGNTGRSTGSHLHFETRFMGQAINPADIIDFENGVPINDIYVFRKGRANTHKSNIYTSADDQLVYHRVKSGDTLGKIARKYGTTVAQLCRLNGLKPTAILRVGQAIRCSAEGSASSTHKQVKKTTTTEVTKEAVASVTQPKTTAPEKGEVVYHTIKSGDTLGAIAQRYGISVSKLCELNGINRNTILRLGRSLRCS